MWNTLSSITDQISQIASEAIGTDDEDDEEEEVVDIRSPEEKEISHLSNVVSAQRAEIERYKEEILELQERLAAGELHSSNSSGENRKLLDDKERELANLRGEHQQLIEEHERLQSMLAKDSSYDEVGEGTAGNVGAPSSFPRSLSVEFGEASFADSIQGELETKRLGALLAKVQAENRRLRNQVAAQSGAGDSGGEWRKAEEEHQQEIATLQALQQERLKQLAASHQEDLSFMQEKQEEAEAKIDELTKRLEEAEAYKERLEEEKKELVAREAEKERMREKEREVEKEREWQRQQEREREKEREIEREKEKEKRKNEAAGVVVEESLEQLKQQLAEEREENREKERQKERAREKEREIEREKEKQLRMEIGKHQEREKQLQADIEKEKERVVSVLGQYNGLKDKLAEEGKRYENTVAIVNKLRAQEEAMMQTVQALVGQKESLLKEREEIVNIFRSLKEEFSDIGESNSLLESATAFRRAFSSRNIDVQRLELSKGRMEREIEGLKKELEFSQEEKKALLLRFEMGEAKRREENEEKGDLIKEKQNMDQRLEAVNAELKHLKEGYEKKLAELVFEHKREVEAQSKEVRDLRLALENERQSGSHGVSTKENTTEEFGVCTRCFVLEQENTALQESVRHLKEQGEEITADAEKNKEELEDLKDKYDKMTKDLVRLRAHLVEKEDVHNLELMEEEARLEELQKKLREYMEKENSLSSLALKYDKLMSDYKEKESECEQNAIAVSNLQSVLEQLQAEQEAQMSYEMGRLNREINLARDQIQSLQEKLHDYEKIKQRCEEAEATVQKQREMLTAKSREIIKLQEEVEPLRRGLEESLRRLHNATENGKNLVDKRLVSKLFVTYFSRASNQQEVLGIMSNILEFSQEEKVQVGLIKSPKPTKGWFFGWGGEASSEAAVHPSGAEVRGDKTLTDLWVEFLLKEASAEEEERRQQRPNSDREKGKEKEKEKEKEDEGEKERENRRGGGNLGG